MPTSARVRRRVRLVAGTAADPGLRLTTNAATHGRHTWPFDPVDITESLCNTAPALCPVRHPQPSKPDTSPNHPRTSLRAHTKQIVSTASPPNHCSAACCRSHTTRYCARSHTAYQRAAESPRISHGAPGCASRTMRCMAAIFAGSCKSLRCTISCICDLSCGCSRMTWMSSDMGNPLSFCVGACAPPAAAMADGGAPEPTGVTIGCIPDGPAAPEGMRCSCEGCCSAWA